MGLFSKVKEAKGFVKGLAAVNQNPLKLDVITAIENGKDQPNFDKLQMIALQTHNDHGRNLILQALDEYFTYTGPDWKRVNNFLVSCFTITVVGSESVVEDMKQRLDKFKGYLKHPNDQVRKEADSLVDLLTDEEGLKKAREGSGGAGGVIIEGGQFTVVSPN